MRARYYSPLSIQRLAEMNATPEDFRAIDKQLTELAQRPRQGYRVPFHQSSESLWRFDVGRFGLIYTFDKGEIEVVTVTG